MLPKIKYLFLLIGSLFIVSPVFAAAPSSAGHSNEMKVRNESQIKACQAKQQVVRTRMENLLRMSFTMQEVFGNIEGRVDEFYQGKVVANGGSLSNYNELIQDIKDKKGDVDSSLETAKLDSMKFSCDNENPKDAIADFRKGMQEVKSSLKDYRTSIKNFIVAVKTANKALPTPEPTGMMEK